MANCLRQQCGIKDIVSWTQRIWAPAGWMCSILSADQHARTLHVACSHTSACSQQQVPTLRVTPQQRRTLHSTAAAACPAAHATTRPSPPAASLHELTPAQRTLLTSPSLTAVLREGPATSLAAAPLLVAAASNHPELASSLAEAAEEQAGGASSHPGTKRVAGSSFVHEGAGGSATSSTVQYDPQHDQQYDELLSPELRARLQGLGGGGGVAPPATATVPQAHAEAQGAASSSSSIGYETNPAGQDASSAASSSSQYEQYSVASSWPLQAGPLPADPRHPYAPPPDFAFCRCSV